MEDHRKFHDEFAEKINSIGCRWGSLQIQRLNDDTQNMKADYKSHYVSLETSMKMFVESILPNMQEKTRLASEKSVEALDSLKRAEKVVERMEKKTDKWTWGLVITMFVVIATQTFTSLSKINQDTNNQMRTEKIMSMMLDYLKEKSVKEASK